MKLVGQLGRVGRNGPALHGADAEREHRNVLLPELRERVVHSPFPALSVGNDQHGSMSSLALVLEDARCRGERSGKVGSGIAEVVGARRVEKEPKRGLIGRERQLEKGAATEHLEPNAVARRGGYRFPGRALGDGETSGRKVGDRHGAGEIEQHEHIAPGVNHVGATASELRPRERHDSESQCRDRERRTQHSVALVGQRRPSGEQRRVAKGAKRLAMRAHAAHGHPRGERHQEQQRQRSRGSEAHVRLTAATAGEWRRARPRREGAPVRV